MVNSWLLDFDGNEIDQRKHGFIITQELKPEDRIVLISNKLGTRMWCDIDTEYIDIEDFELTDFDSNDILGAFP
jgi:hypothetical protein